MCDQWKGTLILLRQNINKNQNVRAMIYLPSPKWIVKAPRPVKFHWNTCQLHLSLQTTSLFSSQHVPWQPLQKFPLQALRHSQMSTWQHCYTSKQTPSTKNKLISGCWDPNSTKLEWNCLPGKDYGGGGLPCCAWRPDGSTLHPQACEWERGPSCTESRITRCE